MEDYYVGPTKQSAEFTWMRDGRTDGSVRICGTHAPIQTGHRCNEWKRRRKKENKYQMPVYEYVTALTPTLFEAALSLSPKQKIKEKRKRQRERRQREGKSFIILGYPRSEKPLPSGFQ